MYFYRICNVYKFPGSVKIKEDYFMCGDGKESYRVPAVMYSEDVIRYITSVCNGCLSYGECTIAKSFSVLDRCENFKGREIPFNHDSRGLPV